MTRRVEVEWDDAWGYRGETANLDPRPMRRVIWGRLTHMTDEVIVVMHDTDPNGDDIYASVIPRSIVRQLTYLREEDQ